MAPKSKKKAKDESSRGQFSAIEARSDEERAEVSPTVKSARKKGGVENRPRSSLLCWKRGPSKKDLKNENANLKTENSGLQERVEQLEAEKTMLEEELQQHQTEKSGLQERVEQLTTEKTEREEVLQKRQKKIASLQQELEEEQRRSQTEKDGLKKQVQQLEKKIKEQKERWQTEKDGLKEQVHQLEKKIKEKEERWQTEVDGLQQHLEADKTELEEIKKREEWCQKQLQQCQGEIRNLREDIKTKTGEKRRLEEDIKTKTAQLADYKHRLSEMASERMRQGNACVEDLNDPFRPTALADKWTGLFKTGEYWTAYSKAQEALKTDEDTAQFLYSVTRIVWKVCYEFVEDFVPRVLVVGPGPSDPLSIDSEKEHHQQLLKKLPEVRRKLSELLPQDASRVDSMVKALEEDYTSVRQTDVPSLQQKLRKAVSQLPKTADPPALLAEKVENAVRADENLNKDVRVDEKFLRKLAGLCYLMRLQEVPLFASFDFERGSSLDLSMFEVDGNAQQSLTDKAIKCILRPPLMRSEGGAVLSKGEADVEPAKPAPDSTNQNKAQDQGSALESQNDDGSPESKENKRDKRNGDAEEDGIETDPLPQDDTSEQDEAQERSANASQTSPDNCDNQSSKDEPDEDSSGNGSQEDSDTSQNNAHGGQDDKHHPFDISID